MKPLSAFPLFLLIALATPSAPALSAPWDGSDRLNRVMTTYDVKAVEILSGTVERIYEKVPSHFPNRYSLGYHLILKTEKETVEVHIGPVWYIRSLEGRIGKGDRIQVIGSCSEGHPSADGKKGMREIEAAEVSKDGAVILKLRDRDGLPLWSDR